MTHTLCILSSLLLCCVLATCADSLAAEDEKFNYDEAKVPPYTLPDPLKMQDGRPVTSVKMWQTSRRPELMGQFRSQVYGQRPPKPEGITYEVTESTPAYLHGKGTRKDVARAGSWTARKGATAGVHAVHAEGGEARASVPRHSSVRHQERKPFQATCWKPTSAGRCQAQRCSDTILDRGYAIATIDPDNLCPDNKTPIDKGR